MKTSDFERILSSLGFTLARTNSHRVWVKDAHRVAVPPHKTINKMIARRLLKEIGYTGKVPELNYGK
jgi:predicted RNA binding protein YcfA (HicA-like mRNA interferase family)